MRIRRLSATLGSLLVAVILGLVLQPGRSAAEGDVFTVFNIAVDATADDAASAREAAMAQGHEAAFQVLLARLVPAEELPSLEPLEVEKIVELVQDFSVADERTSPVRYLAELTFRFNPEAVRNHLRAGNVSFAEARADPLLLLPIYGAAGSERLWRDPNPWRRAWTRRNLTGELVPILLPLGDLDDLAAVTADQALDGDPAGLETVGRRYGAEEVLVSQMVLRGDPSAGTARVRINSTRYSAFQTSSFQTDLSQEADETRGQFLGRARDRVVDRIQSTWKKANLLRFGEESRLLASVPVEVLGDWLEIKRRLDRVPIVVRSEMAYMTRKSVDVMIVYMGDEDQLARTLAQSDLVLTPDLAAGWWKLTLNSGVMRSGGQTGSQ